MRALLSLLCLLFFPCIAQAESLPRLRVSDNQRYLQQEDGTPFFWLGDTAWELFHRLDREQAIEYLDLRAKQGYTVIQAVALAELRGLDDPNPYGHTPLIDNDPTRPKVLDGESNDYWDHVDFIVREANRRGIYIGFLPTWGDKWNKKWGDGPEIFNPEVAYMYGVWLGQRYRDAGIVWIVGGDRPIEDERHRKIIEAMAKGLQEGDNQRHLITFHPSGGSGSSQYFHDAPWLAFNMRQNGHVAEYTGRYDATRQDYDRSPIKPVLDGEPIYEGHPISFQADKLGHSIASDVRRPAYWNLFDGAMGHTYGHHSVWQMWSASRSPINNPLMPWDAAIHEPGASQMQFARRLIESRPMLTRIPDPSILVPDLIATSVPGTGRYHFAATRDTEGTYAMVYAPIGRSFEVRMDCIQRGPVNAWWYDPRTGEAKSFGTFSNTGTLRFLSPDPGEDRDWILVLDDASRHYPPPGQKLSR
jgi:hypothetical protein